MNEATIEIPQNTEKLRDGFVDQAQKIISLESRIERLEAELRLHKKQSYATRSERFTEGEQLDLFEGELREELASLDLDDNDKKQSVKSHHRKVRKPRTIDPALPRVDVIHDLGDAQKHCECGKVKRLIGYDVLEQLAIIPQKNLRYLP